MEREAYKFWEDNLILETLKLEEAWGKTGGTGVWKFMSDEIFKNNRTWQSLKERYQEFLRPKMTPSALQLRLEKAAKEFPHTRKWNGSNTIIVNGIRIRLSQMYLNDFFARM